jgi:LmbE family N-acetylglucosaminyl deacetylase
MSDDSKNDVTIRRERRLEEFLDNEENDNGNWSPPAKVKKAELKKKKAELVLKKDRVTEAFIDQLQEKVLIWSKADPSHMDHMKMGKASETRLHTPCRSLPPSDASDFSLLLRLFQGSFCRNV